MRTIAIASLAVIACAACSAVWFVAALKPASPGAFAFLVVWLAAPHAAMAATLLVRERQRPAPRSWHIIAIMVSIAGVLFLADVIYWHTDAQNAIAVVFTPLYQALTLAVLLALTALASRIVPRPQP